MNERDNIDDRAYALMFCERRLARYQYQWAAFFSSQHRLAIFVCLFVAMSAGVATTQDHRIWFLTPSVAFALTVAVAVVAGSATNYSLRMPLVYRYKVMDKKIGDLEKLADDAYEKAVLEGLSVEQNGPTLIRPLDVKCHYEQVRSWGMINAYACSTVSSRASIVLQ